MSGCVAITCNDASRYSLFWVAVESMQKPPNTRPVFALTSDRVLGRNSCIHQALALGAEWVLFLDDDHVFMGDLLMRLLSQELPVVGSLYLQRMDPFGPIAYSHKDKDDIYWQIRLKDYHGDELVPVAAVGTGGLLVRSEVFHQMPEPWFEHWKTASEDLAFCEKVIKMGVQPYVDLGARLGHMTVSSIWPSFDADQWKVAFDVSDGTRLAVPLEQPELVKDSP